MYALSAQSLDLWLPFLDTFLAEERVRSLDSNDLVNIENMGMFLQQKSGWPGAPPALAFWQRVFAAYYAREEPLQVRRLAEKLETDTSTDKPTRVYCIRELARQKLLEDRHVDMYIQHLRTVADPQAETAIFQALNTLFAVDFRTTERRLQSADRAAQSLLALHNSTLLTLASHIWVARGMHTLCIKGAPAEAREYFARRHQVNRLDHVANLGLLACAIRLGMHEEITLLQQSSASHEESQDPEFATLLDFYRLIEWCDQPEIADNEPVPIDSSGVAHLEHLSLHRYVGDVAEATLGRLSLITGDAQQARKHFDALLQAGLARPAWGYYAAWAYLLCNDRDGLIDCFKRTSRWSGRWTIACMLLDLDPRLAEQSGALALLQAITATEKPIAPVVRVRLELARIGTSTSADEWTETHFLLEEILEAKRTRLVRALAQNDRITAMNLTAESWFRRLPLADSTVCLSLLERDEGRRLEKLHQTITDRQYRRAALVLTTALLRRGRWKEAGQYMDQALMTRTDIKAQLIRAFTEGRMVPIDEAIQQMESLVVLGETHASYILGNLYFYKAARQPAAAGPARLQAALAWQRLLASEQKAVPEDLATLTACASFIAYPQQRASSAQMLIQHFQKLEAAFRQPWLEWHVALALLWYGTPQMFAGVADTLFRVVEMARRADDLTITTLAHALSRFARRLEENNQVAAQFFQLQEHFSQQHKQPATKRVILAAMITGLHALYRSANEQQRIVIERNFGSRLADDTPSGMFILWRVYLALHAQRKAETSALLQTVPSGDPLTPLLRGLLDLLNNTPVQQTLPPEMGGATLSWDALRIAYAIVSRRFPEGYEILLHQDSNAILAPWRRERLFPHLCLAVQQKGSEPPAFLQDDLQQQRAVASDSATLARLAACASALGNGEQACHLWEEALSGNAGGKVPPAWQRECVRVFCRQAVSDYAANKSLEAARKLRLAAHWTTEDLGQQFAATRLLEYARSLELHAVPMLMLAYLFPDIPREVVPLGRYAILGFTLVQNPQLVEALLQQNQEGIQQAWKQLLSTQHNNVRFLHTLSVIYREVALLKQERRTVTEKDWFTSTTLWLLLLSTETFWHYFAEGRITGERQERVKLSDQQREELWQDALENILSYHSTLARKSLAAGEHIQARIHARSLALGRQSEQRLLTYLESVNLSFPVAIEKTRLERIRAQTQKLINDWGQALLAESRKYTDDTGSGAQRKDYARAVGILEPFIRLDVPLLRVLLACLDWYNSWCADLWTHGTQHQREQTTQAANLVCEKLQRISEKKKSYSAENKAIALHLVYRGRALEQVEPERALQAYEEALIWGSTDASLPQKRDDLRFHILEQTVQAHVDAQQFEQAYESLTQAEVSLAQPQLVRQLCKRVSSQHARMLRGSAQYTEALSRARQASALSPEDKELQRFISELEELIPEEPNAQAMQNAEAARATGDSTLALKQIARIPPGSCFFQQAQALRSQILRQDILTSTDTNALEQRETYLRQVIEAGSAGGSKEGLPHAREELSMILVKIVTDELQRIEKLDSKQQHLRRSRLIYAQSQVQEACKLDPRNELAQQHAEILKKLLEAIKDKE